MAKHSDVAGLSGALKLWHGKDCTRATFRGHPEAVAVAEDARELGYPATVERGTLWVVTLGLEEVELESDDSED